MRKKIDFYDLNNNSETIKCTYENFVDCPLCHAGIEPVVIYSFTFKLIDSHFYTLNICPHCNNAFLNKYDCALHLKCSSPREFLTPKIADEVVNISPNFNKIYKESYLAQQNNLQEVAGMGYRKALEFLVKDYAIFCFPDKRTAIINETSLTNCINNYILDDEIKELSKRAAWLGNDQVHYSKLHTDNDFTDLKMIVDLIQYFVNIKLMSFKALKEIVSIKKS